MILILFGKIKTKTKTSRKSGILVAAIVKTKLMFSCLVNVERYRFDEFYEDSNVEKTKNTINNGSKTVNEQLSVKVVRDCISDVCSEESNSNARTVEKIVRLVCMVRIGKGHIHEETNRK